MAATVDPAARMNARLVSFIELPSHAACGSGAALDWYPDFEATHSGPEIERFAEALETRRVGDLMS